MENTQPKPIPVQIQLTFNQRGCPVVSIPASARVEIHVSPGGTDPHDPEIETLKEVVIRGNAEGLTTLAQFLLSVAACPIEGYHQHLDSGAFPSFFRSRDDYWLTIEKTENQKSSRNHPSKYVE